MEIERIEKQFFINVSVIIPYLWQCATILSMSSLVIRLLGNQTVQNVYITGAAFTYVVTIPYNMTAVANTLPDFNTIPIYHEPIYILKFVGYSIGMSLVYAIGFPITVSRFLSN